MTRPVYRIHVDYSRLPGHQQTSYQLVKTKNGMIDEILAGPYDSLEEAETAGNDTDIKWHETYIDSPPFGSQFGMRLIGDKEHGHLERGAGGRLWCYASIGDMRIAVFFANTRGAQIVPRDWYGGDTLTQIEDVVETMNKDRLGISADLSRRIIYSTLSGHGQKTPVNVIKSILMDGDPAKERVRFILAGMERCPFNYAVWAENPSNDRRRDMHFHMDIADADADFSERVCNHPPR